MKRLKKISLWLVGVLVALGVLGGLAAPPLVKSLLTDKLSQKLHRTVNIDSIHINPYALTATVAGFSIKDRDSQDNLFRFDELFVNLSVASLWNRAPVVDEIRLTAPQLKLARLSEQRYNISDLIEEFSKPTDKTDGDSPPARFSVNNIQLIDGRVEFDDRPYGKKHLADAINLALPFVSSLPYFADQYIEPGFFARINGTRVALKGRSKPFSKGRETIVDLNEENLDITKYIEYVPLDLKLKLASALLDTKLALDFSQKKGETPHIGLTGTAVLKNVAINKPSGDWLLKFARLDMALRSLDFAKRRGNITGIQLVTPEVNVLRDRTGALDVLGLMPANAEKTAPVKDTAPGGDPPLIIEVGEIRLSGGRLAFRDESISPEFRAEAKDIDVVVRDFISDGKRPTQLTASLATDTGGRLQTSARLTVAPVSAEGKLALSGIQPNAYAAYYRNALLFDVQEGSLDLAGDYRYARTANGTDFSLGSLTAKLENLRLRQRGQKADFLNLPLLQVSETELDLAKQSLTIGELVTQNAKLNVTRSAKGKWNLASLTPPPAAKSRAATNQHIEAKPWTIAVKKLDLNGYAVNVEDRALVTPAKFLIDNLALSAENFSTARDSKTNTTLKLRLNKRGTLQATGTVSMAPTAANLKVDARTIDLVAFQPYFADRIKITLVSGAASVKGAVSFREHGKTPQFSFAGDLGIAALHSIDKANASDFLKWKSLAVRGIKSHGMPLDLTIADISLKDFYSRLIVNADGKLNLQQIVVTEGAAPDSDTAQPEKTTPAKPEQPKVSPASTASAGAPDYKIRIGGITLSGGAVDFSDRFIKPNYSADLTEIGGTVAALSSDPATRAEVKLTGRVNNDAPLDITGSINPLAQTLYLDLVSSAKGIELSPLTPYAVKYAGYGIEKGKMSLDVKYHIEDGKLTADNKIFLDQLTFGAKVDSPTATRLPVLLAVALLKDRNGNIDLNLPVSGSLNDPQFSIGGLIVKVIINLLVKAATAPFALLGSLFGGGEELNTIDFDAGRAALTAASESKLKSVAKALTERPALKLEVTGHAGAAEDAEAAKKASLEKKVRAQKLALAAKAGTSLDDSENIKITPEEYPKLLEAVYKQEKFSKPRNLIGFTKSEPPEEMEKLILANTAMTDEDLTGLATARARGVRDWLVTKGQVPAERIFLVASKLGASNDKAAKATRVDLSLK